MSALNVLRPAFAGRSILWWNGLEELQDTAASFATPTGVSAWVPTRSDIQKPDIEVVGFASFEFAVRGRQRFAVDCPVYGHAIDA